jgi:hypothetical protein
MSGDLKLDVVLASVEYLDVVVVDVQGVSGRKDVGIVAGDGVVGEDGLGESFVAEATSPGGVRTALGVLVDSVDGDAFLPDSGVVIAIDSDVEADK